jgi:HEAT repeat protein
MAQNYVLAVTELLAPEGRDGWRGYDAPTSFLSESTETRVTTFLKQESIGSLDQQLRSAVEPRLRYAAAHMLAERGEPGLQLLIKALTANDEQTQVMAAMALSKMGRAVLAPLSDTFWKSLSYARQKMVWVLYSAGKQEAIHILIEALSDHNAKVRRYAAWALGYLKAAEAVPHLIKALDDYHYKVRFDSAAALVKIGQRHGEEIAQALIKALEGGARARKMAATALAWLHDTLAIDALAMTLRDANPSVRAEAAFALGWIRHPQVVHPLIEALSDPDPQVRAQAAAALGWVGDKRAVEPLIWLIEDEDRWVPYAAVEALGDIGDVRAIAPLVLAYEGANNHVRRSARDALRKLGYPYVT